MLKQKEPVVFEPKNLESLIQGLDKKDLESLIKIIKYKIESANKNFGFVVPDDKKFTQDIYIPSRYFSGGTIASQIYKENGEIKKITIGGVVKLSDKLEIEL